jgi:hypothetical protein
MVHGEVEEAGCGEPVSREEMYKCHEDKIYGSKEISQLPEQLALCQP